MPGLEINGLTGLSGTEQISLLLSFVLFGAYVTAEAAALALFFLTSRPRYGRVRTAAVWHLLAAWWFLVAIVALGVWAAPAEKAFTDDPTNTRLFPFAGSQLAWRFDKVEISVILAVLGMACLLFGVFGGGRQRRIWQRASLPAL